MKTVALSFVGTKIDAGKGPDRWNHWRPNVALCQQDDLVVDRLDQSGPVGVVPCGERLVPGLAGQQGGARGRDDDGE